MSPSFAFFTFLNALWIMAFFAVPFCVEYEEGSGKTAPKSIRWKKLITLAIILAFLVTVVLALVIKSGIISVK